jgi:hypothetical protein
VAVIIDTTCNNRYPCLFDLTVIKCIRLLLGGLFWRVYIGEAARKVKRVLTNGNGNPF